MKQKSIYLVLILIALLFVVGWADQTSKPQQWEYKFEYNVSEKKANELGAQGWELAAAPVSSNGSLTNTFTFVFRRAKQNLPTP